ncbi:MAG: methyl-accepting chemotaxis protein, partial [Bacteroidota bacterium]|nr:methyl-accepting chemotaxis protein [Bacteroidota bacterium]
MFRNKRKVAVGLVVFLFSLFFFAGLSVYFSRFYNVEYVSNLLARSVVSEVGCVDKIFDSRGDVSNEELLGLSDNIDYRDFLVLKGDSVVFFSNSEAFIAAKVLKSIDSLVFQKLLNRDVIVRKIRSDISGDVFHIITIRKNYSIKNSFLVDRFLLSSKIPEDFNISKEGGFPVFYRNNVIFNIKKSGDIPLKKGRSSIVFIAFLLLLITGFSFMKTLYSEVLFFRGKSLLKRIGLGGDMLLIVFLLHYFRFPAIVFKTFFFDSSMIYVSRFFDSLGIAILYMIPFTFFIWFLFEDLKCKVFKKDYLIQSLLLFIAANIFLAPYFFIKTIVKNSVAPLELYDVTSLGVDSFLTFFIIALVLMNASMVIRFIFKLLKLSQLSFLKIFLLIFVPVVLYGIVLVFSFEVELVFILLFFVVVVLGSAVIEKKYPNNFSYPIYLFLVSAAIYGSYFIMDFQQEKEIEKIKLKTISLANNRDQIAEYQFLEISDDIKQDKEVLRLVKGFLNSESVENETDLLLSSRFFDGFFKKYDVNFTVCDNRSSLVIDDNAKPVSCKDFFDDVIDEYGKQTISKNLFYLDDGDDLKNYLGVITWKFSKKVVVKLYIDLISKNTPFAQGYPELLVDEANNDIVMEPKYSYALYNKNTLVSSYGDYSFELNKDFSKCENGFFVNSENGFIHIINAENKSRTLIISRKEVKGIDRVAGFTFFFLLLSIVFLFIGLFASKKRFSRKSFTFRSRLQVSIFGILLGSFFIIGVFIFTHLSFQNDIKDTNNLKGLSHSILIELEHKFAFLDNIEEVDLMYAQRQLVKFSQVFFADINVYDCNGYLFSTSRPQVFEKGIISKRINSDAFNELADNSKSIFIHKEFVGSYEYLSAYFPLRNYENKTIAYVNLPYFNKQRQLRLEIASFLTTFINIYVILTVLSLLLVWIISNYITKPIELIKKHLRQTKFINDNVKILWEHEDEIGELVSEYNKMVDELEKSAKLLAASERES